MASTINASTSAGLISTGDTSGVLALQTNSGTTAVTIDTSQNVGIGVTPAASYGQLQVYTSTNGTIASFGTGAGVHSFSSSGYYSSAVTLSSGGTWTARSTGSGIISPTNSGIIQFYTDTGLTSGNTFSPTERMRIDSSGNLLVGTTAQPATGTGIQVISFNNAYYGLRLSTSNSGGASCIQFLNSAGTQQGLISHNGTGTTTYGTSSDYRLKDNPQPMQNALETVAKLNPVTYTWKIDGSIGQGFIAHELQEIFPDAVQGKKDDVNEDGSIKPQGIDTSFLVATLTAAIQEQQALITAQAETINALTARVVALEQKGTV